VEKAPSFQPFLLQHELENGRLCKIYCTQPRRISAISLARRVAEEMGEGKNNVGGLVGYAIRLENMVSNATRLVYATTGNLSDEVSHRVLFRTNVNMGQVL
jgi:ATP-dependent RNA helicase DHX29